MRRRVKRQPGRWRAHEQPAGGGVVWIVLRIVQSAEVMLQVAGTTQTIMVPLISTDDPGFVGVFPAYRTKRQAEKAAHGAQIVHATKVKA